jgi:N-formylglutamate amidohydrolase
MARFDTSMTASVTKREAARGLLTAMFRERPRILIAEIMDAAAERAISRRTMTRACGDLGITEIHNGPFGGIWAWPQDQHPSS